MSKRPLITTNRSGVLYREHVSRKHGSRPDRYYVIRYRGVDGKRHMEALGWASEGWKLEMAFELRCTISTNIKTGKGPMSLAEMRAEEVAAREVAENEQHRQRLTFADLADAWMTWANQNKKSARTDRSRLDIHILPLIGSMVAADITTQDIETVKNYLLSKPTQKTGKPLSPESLIQCLGLIRSIFNLAADTGLLDVRNPVRLTRKRGRGGIVVQRPNNRRLRVLTRAEIEKLIADALAHNNPDMADIIVLAADTGLRLGELCALMMDHFTPESGRITILESKSGQSRVVYAGTLWPNSLPMLARRKDVLRSGYLFPGRDGGRRYDNQVGKRFCTMAARCGLNDGIDDPRLRAVFHSLRHTFATRQLEAGLDIYTLSKLMGHADISTTEIYLHMCDQTLRNRALVARTPM